MGQEYDRLEDLSSSEFRRLWLRWANTHGAQLARVESKVDKTNGRVRSLELWRAGMLGGIAVVTAIVVPLFLRLVGE